MTGTQGRTDEPVMIYFDIPDNGGYYLASPGTEITADSVRAFLAAPGERQQLG